MKATTRPGISVLACCVLLLPVLAVAREVPPGPPDAPRIGLVLSGGGARGLAHIGVLRALEEQHIRIDAITGTSMGAFIGGLYASGRTPDEIEQIVMTIDWSGALEDLPPRSRLSFRRKQDSRLNVIKAQLTFKNGLLTLPKGAVQGQNLQVVLQEQFLHVSDITDFDQLSIPFRAIASDLVTGEAYVFSSGSMSTAIRASMSVPGIFAPVEIDGKMLIDGGIANNLPVGVAKAMGVDHVIAVDIATPLYTADELTSVIPIIEQLTTMLTFGKSREEYELLKPEDLLITPALNDITSVSFESSKDIIRRGYESVSPFADQLAKYASDAGFRREPVVFDPPVINGIRIVNDGDISDKLIRANIEQKIGEPLDLEVLRQNIDSIYGYQYFESVRSNVLHTGDEHILEITTTEKSWGKDLVGVSLELYTDTDTESDYNLGLNFRRTELTSRGGEWFIAAQAGQDPGIHTELYLPIDYQQRTFVRPYAGYQANTQNQSNGDTIVSRLRITEAIYGAFFGIEFGNRAILGAGSERHDGKVETFVGTPAPTTRFDDIVHYGLAEFDTLNNLSFPTAGSLARLRYDVVRPQTPRADYEIVRASLVHAFPIKNDALVFHGRYVRSSGPVDRHLQPSLGGLKNQSGLHEDDLVDSNIAYLSLTYFHRLNQRSLLLNLPLYVGFSIETGNAWANAADISLSDTITSGLAMVGVDTPLGPVYVGYGRTDTHRSAIYLQLGHLIRE